MKIRLYLITFMLMALSIVTKAADVAYAVYNPIDSTLTFRYGAEYGKTIYYVPTEDAITPDWNLRKFSIKKVVFEKSFSQARPISCYMWFEGMNKLTTIVGIENLNTSEVVNMSMMFWQCASLASLDVSNFDTSNVTNMAAMFDYCSSLTSLDVSKLNTSKVISMAGMFFGCSSLTHLDLKSFDTSKVKNMDGMFYGCSSLTHLDLKGFNTSSVTDMNEMFYGCSSLTSLDVSGFDTHNVNIMSKMFSDCSSLETIYSNDLWTCGPRSSDMFLGCSRLRGAISYDSNKVDVNYANPSTGYFTYVLPYGLTICGTSITGANYDKISSINGVTGEAYYDHASNTLTLTDCSISYADGVAIKSSLDSLNVRLVGSNGILAATGLESTCDLTILGDGKLSIQTTGTGINMTNTGSSGELVICDGAKVDIVANDAGIRGVYFTSTNKNTGKKIKVCLKSFRLSGGSTDVTISASTAAVVDMKNLVRRDGLVLTSPIGARFNDHAVCDADGNIIADKTVRISLLGDANGDGSVTMADANLVVNYFLATYKSDIHGFDHNNANANGDVDDNGQPSITMADANMIVNMFLSGEE